MSELAEGARLEIVCAVKSGTEGSNPSLSAKKILVRNVDELTSSSRRIDLGQVYPISDRKS